MATQPNSPFPSVDRIAHFAAVASLCETYGRSAVIDAIRAVLDEHRARREQPEYLPPGDNELSRQ
ncbi:MAG TPA: hypothetical protein VNR40_10260, partial [Steroidobacter sp.]|nr:hypothetical protein [Steroidobacter sp.]